MTKFERVGASIQYGAYNKDYALTRFNQSCEICCHRGLHLRCDQCGINVAHELVIATFDMEANKKGDKSNNGNKKHIKKKYVPKQK